MPGSPAIGFHKSLDTTEKQTYDVISEKQKRRLNRIMVKTPLFELYYTHLIMIVKCFFSFFLYFLNILSQIYSMKSTPGRSA